MEILIIRKKENGARPQFLSLRLYTDRLLLLYR